MQSVGDIREFPSLYTKFARLCRLVVRVTGYRCRGPGSILGATRFSEQYESGRGGPYGYETSRLSYFLDNRLTNGSEVVSLMRGSPFTTRKISGTHCLQRLSRPRSHSVA
jgi:hypothetical protein